MKRWVEDTRLSMCERKAFYRDRETAEVMARVLGLDVYVCRSCHLFHLTKGSRRRSTRGRLS